MYIYPLFEKRKKLTQSSVSKLLFRFHIKRFVLNHDILTHVIIFSYPVGRVGTLSTTSTGILYVQYVLQLKNNKYNKKIPRSSTCNPK